MAIEQSNAESVSGFASKMGDDAQSASSQLANRIGIMDSRKFVNSSFPFLSDSGFVGGIKRVVKQIFRNASRPYIEPIVAKQNLFNDASFEVAQCLSEIVSGLEERMKRFESEVSSFVNARDEIAALLEEVDIRKKPFTEFDKRTTSQCGEDAIIMYVLRMLGFKFSNIHYLDLGANHAISLSNTFMLYREGARGVLVEANPALITELKIYRSEDVVINRCVTPDGAGSMDFYVLNGDGLSTPDFEEAQAVMKTNSSIALDRVVKVESVSVNTLFEKYFDGAPEIVNIDVEGTEIEILKSIDFEKYRPLIFIIETIPYRTHLVHGEKRTDIVQVMLDVGYEEYAFTGINSVFIDARKLGGQSNA